MFKSKAVVLLGALAVSGAVSADLSTGLVAHWSFDDCTAIDVSGNGHDGTIQGNPQCVAGHQGKSLSFNGTDDFVEVLDENADFSPPNLTVSIWVNPGDSQSSYAGIIDKSHAFNNIGGWVLQKSAIGNGLPFYFSYCNLDISQCAQLDGDQRITVKPKVWNHLVITKQGSTVINYLNGKQISKKTYSFSDYTKTTFPLLIGAVNGLDRYFMGLLMSHASTIAPSPLPKPKHSTTKTTLRLLKVLPLG